MVVTGEGASEWQAATLDYSPSQQVVLFFFSHYNKIFKYQLTIVLGILHRNILNK